MSKRIAIILSVLLCCSISVLSAQESRSLPFLEINADTRTAGMGDAVMGDTESMFLYTNPTAFLQQQANFYASYTFGLYPKVNDDAMKYHAFSGGYKIMDNYALLVGFRFFDGLNIPQVGEDMIPMQDIKPMDWSIDLSYAIRISSHLSAYAGGALIQSYNGYTGYTGSATAGIYYRNILIVSGNTGSYSVGFSLNDFGGKIKYGKNGSKNSLPSSLGLGGSVTLPFSKAHKVNAVLATRYFMLPSDAKAFTGGVGVEYEWLERVSVRTGYHWGNDNGYLTLGLGYRLKGISLDAACSCTRDKDLRLFRVGLSAAL
ncbi:PorV/PorQ family protein [Porphyromonas macacae]|uniref:PorV/PorQ family protein n=1 Tax=Porphyromonas macacae TaxID=28115 RepID=UPI001376DF04|nr:PorV/PorQ family protein [Porphyromonas macacae]